MRRVGGSWVGGGPVLPGASLGAPGALGRALVRLAAAGLALAAVAALVLAWPESPAPNPPEPPAPGVAVDRPPAPAVPGPPAVPGGPEVGVPDVGVGGGAGSGAPPRKSSPAPEPAAPEAPAEPVPVKEKIHEHVYEFDYRGAPLTILGALLAVGLAFLRLPATSWVALPVAAVGALALWLGIDFVYAGQFPEVFDYREAFYEDEVQHVVTEVDHSHPVIVQVPLVIIGLGASAWSGWVLWREARAARRAARSRAVGSV